MRHPDHLPGYDNALAYCPHCERALFRCNIGESECWYCKNPIKWPADLTRKKKPKMVIVRRR